MNPLEHLLIGWAVANAVPLERRDRALVTLAAVAPDVDAFGFLPELLTRNTPHELFWFSEYHHILGHNIAFAAAVTIAAAVIAKQRARTALLACISFHSHLAGDVIGGRGPDGYQWPIPYLLPFSDRWQWTWSGQWMLNSWQNFAITIPLMIWALWLAWKRGRSPVELLSTRANDALVRTLRTRFGEP